MFPEPSGIAGFGSGTESVRLESEQIHYEFGEVVLVTLPLVDGDNPVLVGAIVVNTLEFEADYPDLVRTVVLDEVEVTALVDPELAEEAVGRAGPDLVLTTFGADVVHTRIGRLETKALQRLQRTLREQFPGRC